MRAMGPVWRLLLVGALAGAACDDRDECREPCPEGQRCAYGICVPIHDARADTVEETEDGEATADGNAEGNDG